MMANQLAVCSHACFTIKNKTKASELETYRFLEVTEEVLWVASQAVACIGDS